MTSFFNTQSNFRTRRNIEQAENSIINSRNLYEDVVRKNQEIIKQILAKINDLYSRQEEFDCSIKMINEKLHKINETNEELHHQFRAHNIEIQRKHQGLLNDINGVKGILKVPDLSKTHQEYLQSDFFKEQSACVNIRSRSIKKVRHKTNFSNLLPENKENLNKPQKTQKSMDCESKVKPFSQVKIVQKTEIEVEDYFKQQEQAQVSNALAERQSKLSKQIDDEDFQIRQRIEVLQQKLEAGIKSSRDEIKLKNMELSQAIKNLQSQIQVKMEKISLSMRREQDWGHINFQELHRYLEGKIKEQLHQKVSKKYFEDSLNNLKQSWQEELDQAYLLINSKLDNEHLIALQEKINDLRSQFQCFNSLNSIKIQNISYSSTCKSTPQRFSPRERNSSGQALDNNRNTRQSDDYRHSKKNETQLSNSCSSVLRFKKANDEIKMTLNGDEESMVKWKGKVMETLGLASKKVRRVKRND